MRLLPISLKLEGRKCVVVGGGRIASAKAAGLLRQGASVVVISPRATAWVRSQARTRKLVWLRHAFKAADLKGAFLVVAATDSYAVNGAVFQACKTQRVLCNVVDDPERCDFFYNAVVHRGDLQIAISTGGQSPALASRLRKELEKQFTEDWGTRVAHIGEMRRQILASQASGKTRQNVLKRMVEQHALSEELSLPVAPRRALGTRPRSKRGRRKTTADR